MSAIGQERLQVTPLQMALVAAAVANGGKLMRPHLVRTVRTATAASCARMKPSEQSDVMKRGHLGAAGADDEPTW